MVTKLRRNPVTFSGEQSLAKRAQVLLRADGGVDGAGFDDNYSAYEQDPDSGEWVTGSEAARRRAAKLLGAQAATAPAQTTGAQSRGPIPYIAPDQQQAADTAQQAAAWSPASNGKAAFQREGLGDNAWQGSGPSLADAAKAILSAASPGSMSDKPAAELPTTAAYNAAGSVPSPGAKPIEDFISETVQNMHGLNNGAAGYGLGDLQSGTPGKAVGDFVANQVYPDNARDLFVAYAPFAEGISKGIKYSPELMRAYARSALENSAASVPENAARRLIAPAAELDGPGVIRGLSPTEGITDVAPISGGADVNPVSVDDFMNGPSGATAESSGMRAIDRPSETSGLPISQMSSADLERAADALYSKANLMAQARLGADSTPAEKALWTQLDGYHDEIARREGMASQNARAGEVNANDSKALPRGAAGENGPGGRAPMDELPSTPGAPAANGVAEPPAQSPVQKLSEALKSAEKATPEQQAMFDQQRSQQAGRVASAYERGSGSDAFTQARQAAAGEFSRPSFKLPDIAPEDVQALHETINTSPTLQPFDKMNAGYALTDLFDGRIPQPAQMKSLVTAFQGDRDFIDSVAQTIRKAAPPNLADYAGEWWMNSVLSGPLTQVRNHLGNMSSAMASPVEKFTSAGVEQVLARAQGRAPERFFAEAPANLIGMVKGIPEGINAGLQTIRFGASPLEVARADLGQHAFPGLLGKIIRGPTTMMEAGDQMWQVILQRGELNSEAVRLARVQGLKGEALQSRIAELMSNPSPEMIAKSAKTAEYRLFRSPAGKFTQDIISARDHFPGLKYIIPFIRTPVNLAKFGIERSPLGFFDPALWHNIAAKSPEAADQIGRAVLGTTIATGFAAAVASGQVDITAGAPTNAAARDRFYREGKLPFAIKIGDHWLQYSQLQPLNETLTTLAASVDAIRNGKDPTAAALQAVTTIGQNLADQTYMTGLSNLMQAIQDPGRFGPNFAERTATGLIPFSGAQRFAANLTDRTVRQPKGMLETAEAGIPGLSQNVPARQTAFGEDAPKQSPAYSPVQVTADQTTPVDTELGRLGKDVGFVGGTLGGFKLSREQQDIYQRVAGQATKSALSIVFADPRYEAANDVDKEKAIDRAQQKARDKVQNPVSTMMDSAKWKGSTPEQQALLLDMLLKALDSGWSPPQ